MKAILVAISALITLTTAALADDRSTGSSSKPGATYATGWVGLYVGINAGGMNSADNSFGFSATDTGNAGLGSIFSGPGALPRSFTMTESGGLVGGTIGYNWQITPHWILGAEADLDYAGLRSSATLIGPFGTQYPHRLSMDFLGTARGRLGYAPTPDLLLFGTGGLAYAKTNFGSAFVCTNCAPLSATEPLTSTSTSKLSLGWSAGAGTEWKFSTHWSAKAEYVYVDLGPIGNTIVYTYGPSISTLTSKHDIREHVFRLGLNWQMP